MMRKQRGRAGQGESSNVSAGSGTSGKPGASLSRVRDGKAGPCVVCGMSDARGLVEIDLAEEPCIMICGSHEVMHRRSGWESRTVAELRAAFGNRRNSDRRGGPGEVDELAEKLSAAFMRDRRATSRRAS